MGDSNSEQADPAREDAAAELELQPHSDAEEEHLGWIAERARLREALHRAQQEVGQARSERGGLLAQMREGNEKLVIASVHADELAERAEAGRRRAEALAAQLTESEAATRMSERQLRESEEQLRAALVAGKMAHWRWDPETPSLAASETMNDVYGLLTGKAFRSKTDGVRLIHAEDEVEYSAVVEAAKRDRHGWQREFRIIRPRDHELAWLEESATFVVHSLTGKCEFVGLVRDITERKQAELLLREKEQHARILLSEAVAARADAEAATRAKDEFLTTVNHELRTPLAAILLWARALRDGVDSAQNARAIEAITQSAHSLSQLIEDVLDLSRLTSGGYTLAMSAVDFAAVVSDAADMIRPMMAAKAIAFDVEIEPASIVAEVDASRMKQILGNMLVNAGKFTPPGGAVRLRVQALETRIEVELSDTGDGIAAEFLPYVFERFRQADMSDTRRHKGLGIGLAITKELVELHGGSVEVQSEGLGRGAVFHIQFPWTPPDDSSVLPVGNPTPSSRRLALAGVSVLLVEGDLNTRDAMQWTLAREGACVVSVPTGEAALKALHESHAPDIIISELGLPDISGFELMGRVVGLSRQQGHPVPPSCALSARTGSFDRRLAIEAGFDLFLAKPVTPEKLVEALTDLREVLAARHDSAGSVATRS